ncbi:MAG TPA: Ig-like domain-containing protein, partial [Ramlibacter sp.]
MNDPTVFGGNSTGIGNEDAGVISGVLTATDADGMTNPGYVVTAAAGHGTATIDAITGAWSYTPDADYNGADSFTVTVTDNAGNTATRTINLSVTPVTDIVTDTATTAEDTAVTRDVLANDSFEGAGRSITAVTNGAHGTVTIVDAALGLVRYTPDANYNGTDAYTYTVTSGGVSETVTVNVTITPVNDTTTFGGTTGSGNEDAGSITGTLTVADADGITAPAFTVTANGGHGTASINPTTGAWTYTPAADYTGPDSFTVRVTDTAGNTSTQVITVNVGSVADIADDTATVAEDSSVTTNVRGNDSFEGSTATITAVTNGAHGTVTIIDAAAGTVRYTPDANWHGTDTYTYRVTSGGVTETATVTVTVNPVNDAAVFTGTTSGSTTEDGSAINGTLNAVDVDGMATPNYTVTGLPGHGTATINAAGAWTYTPAADYNGADSFTVTVTDDAGNTTTQVISLTVTAVADVANDTVTVAEDGTVTTSVRVNDSFEGTPTLTAVTQGAHGTVTIVDAAAGTVLYTPNPNYNGPDSYTYTVTSGGVTETATVTVNVTPVDDAASFGGATSGSGNEDAGVITGVLTAADPVDGMGAPAFTVTGNPAHGTATINATTGTWTYRPAADYNGPDSFTV